MADLEAKATLKIDVEALGNLTQIQAQLDAVNAKLKTANSLEDRVRLRTEAKALGEQYRQVEQSATKLSHSTDVLSSQSDKLGKSIVAQGRALVLGAVGINAAISGLRGLYNAALEAEGGIGKLTSANARMQRSLDDLKTQVGTDMKDAFTGAAGAIGIAAKGLGAFLQAWKETAGGIGSVIGGGSFSAGMAGAGVSASADRQRRMSEYMSSAAYKGSQKFEQESIKAEMKRAAEEQRGLDKTAEDFLKTRDRLETERVETLKAQKIVMDAQLENIERQNQAEREMRAGVAAQRGRFGSAWPFNPETGEFAERGGGAGGAGAGAGIDWASMALEMEGADGAAEGGGIGIANIDAIINAEKELADARLAGASVKELIDLEDRLNKTRIDGVMSAIQMSQGLMQTIAGFRSGNSAAGIAGISSLAGGVGEQIMPGAGGVFGYAAGAAASTISGITSGDKQQREQAVAGAVGFAVAGPVGYEVGKALASTFGSGKAKVHIENAEEIASNIAKELASGNAMRDAFGINPQASQKWFGAGSDPNAAQQQFGGISDASGLSIQRLMELRYLMGRGAAASAGLEAGGTRDDPTRRGQAGYINEDERKQFEADAQAGAAAMEEYIGALQTMTQTILELDEAQQDFNDTMGRTLAELGDGVDEYLSQELIKAQEELENTTDGLEAMEAAARIAAIAQEQYERQLSQGTNLLEAFRDAELGNLADEFDEVMEIIGRVADAEKRRADVLEAQESKRFELDRLRYSLTNRYEEQNPDEMYTSLIGEFQSRLGGADLTNDRDAQRLLGILGEAQGTIGAARRSPLGNGMISGETALGRVDEVEDLYNQIYDAQEAARKAERDTALGELAGAGGENNYGLGADVASSALGRLLFGADASEALSQTSLAESASLLYQDQQLQITQRYADGIDRLEKYLKETAMTEITTAVNSANNKTDQQKLDDQAIMQAALTQMGLDLSADPQLLPAALAAINQIPGLVNFAGKV